MVLGLGNLLLGDEGVGVHAARVLQGTCLPPAVEVIDGGTGGFELIGHLAGASKVIVIDCARVRGTPGALVRLTLDDLRLDETPSSAHEGGVRELLRHVRDLSPRPEVVVIGVVPQTVDEPRLTLTPPVRAALPKIVAAVCDEALDAGSDPRAQALVCAGP